MAENWDKDGDDSSYQQQNNSNLSDQFEASHSANFERSSNSRTNNSRFKREQRGRNSHSNNNNGRERESRAEQCTFFIETAQLGKLIGRGGSQIRELQDQTNTKININKGCVNGDSTQIVVIGSKDSQDQAKSLIDDLLGDSIVQIQSNVPKVNESKQDDSNQLIDWDKAAEEYEKYQKEKWAKFPELKKDFYVEDPIVANMSKEQADQIRQEKNNINVEHTFELDESAANSPEHHIQNPIQTFEQAFKNYPDILTEIEKQGFETPSPIQCQAWPILLSGKDMIGVAQTGTGKTLAFLLPALIHIDGQSMPRNERPGPTVLVMAPTRELALQIEKEVNKYYYHGIKAVCVYGGGDRKKQKNIVSKGVEIVIATPGRLNDLVQDGCLDVTGVSYLVLDEADRMLDMGFEPQIRKTLIDVRPDRQSVMTSATWPPGVRRLAQSYMKNPITVCVGSLDLKATHSVTQKIYIIEDEEKADYLKEFFHNMGLDDKVIVFFGKKSKVDDIGSDLALSGVKCQSIHGGREQSDREQALEDIKSGSVRILLATDVASRGIDIEDITHVLNYDFPRDIEEYVHRVGRTGRAGRSGESISFMTRRDWGQAANLIKILEEAEQEIPDELYNMAERFDAMKKRRAEEDRGKNGRRFGDGARRGGGRDRHGGGGTNRW